MHKYGQYSRAFLQGWHHYIQGEDNNNPRLKFQADHTEGIEGNGLKIKGIKQAQTMITIFEGIYRRGGNTSINLMKGYG